MCTHPIIMRNPAKNRYGGMEYIKVPCRNCPECAKSMQSDYTCRAIALWNSLPLYYYAYFCTLTFNNENLPTTNVYKLSKDGSSYDIAALHLPCFDHTIYRRFRKNFQEFIHDVYHCPAYLLTTCEYGEKFHRPHYHCILFVPYYSDWKLLKVDLERFWHYGFTMDKRIACVDGVSYNRSFINAIDYVTKYVCKYNQWQPFYLKSDEYVTDYPPSDIKPRVFCSKNFGSSLEASLSESNYRLNNIYLSVKGDRQDVGRTFQLPSYYRRRKHVSTHIVFSYTDKFYWSNYLRSCLNDSLFKFRPPLPYLNRILHRPKVFRKVYTERSDLYCQYLYNDFKSSLATKLFHYDKLVKENSDFKLSLIEKFGNADLHFKSLYDKICSIYLERRVYPIDSFSFSLSLPYRNMVENITKTHYFIPKGLNLRQARSYFYQTQKEKRDFALPWLTPAQPAIYFRTLKAIPYSSMPSEYAKLEYLDEYCRNFRIKQHKLKELRDFEWYKIHVIPYNKQYEVA